jgi:membrane-bound inhibitor of C-type lysozyme
MSRSAVIIIALLVAIGSIFAWSEYRKPSQQNTDSHECRITAGYSWCDKKSACIQSGAEYCTATPPKRVLFTCDAGKTITATFYPTDDAYVDLVLHDGRKLSVPRALSGSGARYATTDESFVFWNKGDTAFITESDDTTFSNCVTTNTPEDAQCLITDGYTWSEYVGACIRESDMTQDIMKAAKIAIANVGKSSGLMVVSFNSYEEPGAYDIMLSHSKDTAPQTIYIRNWQIQTQQPK